MKKKLGCFLVFICCCGLCAAQQVVSSGGNAVKSDFSVNWILGGSLSDIPAIDHITLDKLREEQLMESEIFLKIYPIPATDFIHIEIAPVDTGRLILELYNTSGVKVLNNVVSSQPILQVNINNIPSGAYFLKVSETSNDQLFKVGKIIKK